MKNIFYRNSQKLTKILFVIIQFTALNAKAHFTVQDTGDLISEDQMQLSTELQLKMSGDRGLNILGRLDKGFNGDSNLRFMAGAGTTDYELGAFYKWVPFPDYENQPAIGFTFGTHIAHYSKEFEMAGRFIPFVSKKFETEKGDFTPYASMPVAFVNYDDDTYTTLQFAMGTRFKAPDFEHCDFTAELGFNLNESFSYVSVGAIFPAF